MTIDTANKSNDSSYSFSDKLYIDIIKTYLDILSVKETADKLKTSEVKVRKVLITENLWQSKTSLEIEYYLRSGKTTSEIAKLLSTTEKAVQQYLPYSRGVYNGDNRSVAALNSADYRLRIRTLQSKINKKREDLAVEKGWDRYSAKDMEIESEGVEGAEEAVRKNGQAIQDILGSGEITTPEEFYPGILRLPEGTDTSGFPRFDVIRLHLELMKNDYTEEQEAETTRVLKTYGKVEYGSTISRDILVPSDLPLWALNYAIQRCFGWQNSHLHQFELPDEQFKKITDGTVGKYAKLVGVVFRSPWMDENEDFWQDDYESGSFKTWIRKKYTGPFYEMTHGEGIWQCKEDLKAWKKRYEYVEVEHHSRSEGEEFYNWPKPISKEEYERRKSAAEQWRDDDKYAPGDKVRTEVFAFEDIPIDVCRYMSERSCGQLLERLSLDEVLAIHDKGIEDELFAGDTVPECFDEVMDEDLQFDIEDCLQYDSPMKQPYAGMLTDELHYNYDFGDNWYVRITGSLGAADLVESGRVAQEELEEAVLTVYKTYRPVCIAQDGYPVLDDVGGINGYVMFLKGINQSKKSDDVDDDEYGNEYGMYEDKQASLEWAKSLGWSKRRVSNKNLL